MSNYPKVILTEEGMRDGLQIERADIPVAGKIRLLDMLSETGSERNRGRLVCQSALGAADGVHRRVGPRISSQAGCELYRHGAQ